LTAVVPDRLGLVMELARQLGHRPTSNRVRELLRCSRATANQLLEELDRVAPELATSGLVLRPPRLTATVDNPVEQERATGPQVAPGSSEVAPAPSDQTAPSPLWTGWRRGVAEQVRPVASPVAQVAPDTGPPVRRGWLILLALPAFVAVWGGWVGLGGLAGFGPVRLLPGIADHVTLNLAVTLPAGMEVYAVIGLRVWLSVRTRTDRTRRFAAWSSCASLGIGCMGQVAYHVLSRPATGAPMFITVCVACLPVVILGAGAALFHLVGDDQRSSEQPS
jgi:hypothetical protein